MSYEPTINLPVSHHLAVILLSHLQLKVNNGASWDFSYPFEDGTCTTDSKEIATKRNIKNKDKLALYNIHQHWHTYMYICLHIYIYKCCFLLYHIYLFTFKYTVLLCFFVGGSLLRVSFKPSNFLLLRKPMMDILEEKFDHLVSLRLGFKDLHPGQGKCDSIP